MFTRVESKWKFIARIRKIRWRLSFVTALRKLLRNEIVTGAATSIKWENLVVLSVLFHSVSVIKILIDFLSIRTLYGIHYDDCVRIYARVVR